MSCFFGHKMKGGEVIKTPITWRRTFDGIPHGEPHNATALTQVLTCEKCGTSTLKRLGTIPPISYQRIE